jgi:hypothetical protein
MSTISIKRNHLKFEKNLNDLIEYGLEIITENITVKKDRINKKEKNILLESLLLRSCAYWEIFLEKEIIILISLNSDRFKLNMELPSSTKLNLKLIRAILYGDEYRDFHDIKHFRSYFSKILVEEYNPFTNITNEQLNKINITYTIRNYLSHYSEYSKKKLYQAYMNNFNYKIFQEPGIFLLKEKGKYFENLIHNFVLVSVTMRSFLGVKDE